MRKWEKSFSQLVYVRCKMSIKCLSKLSMFELFYPSFLMLLTRSEAVCTHIDSIWQKRMRSNISHLSHFSLKIAIVLLLSPKIFAIVCESKADFSQFSDTGKALSLVYRERSSQVFSPLIRRIFVEIFLWKFDYKE